MSTAIKEKTAECLNNAQQRALCYPFQKNLIESQDPKQIWVKSRQIGWSFGIALRAYIRGLSFSHYETLYFSVAQRLSVEWLDKIRLFMSLDNIDPVINKQTEIKLPNGSRFIALPQNPSTARSYSPDEIYLDEFAHYKQDKKMLTAIAPSLSRKDKQRVLIIGSTPFGKLGEFFRVYDGANDYKKSKVDIYDAIAQGVPLNVEACRNALPDDLAFQQEHLCMFVDDVTSFFPYNLIKEAWNEALTNTTFEGMGRIKNPLIAGYDPGKFQDSGVFMVVEKDKDKVVQRHCKKWLGTSYTEQLKYIMEAMTTGKITKLFVDRTGVGEKLYEDLNNKFGSRVTGVTFTNPVKEKMIIDLKVLFENQKIEIFYDMELTNQLHGLQRSILPSKNVRYSHQSGEHDDMVWALALATVDDLNTKTISVRVIGA